MLFIIPGFPFITSGIDLAKLDLRSGLERLTYAIIIVLVATMFAWIMALLLKLKPVDFAAMNIDPSYICFLDHYQLLRRFRFLDHVQQCHSYHDHRCAG